MGIGSMRLTRRIAMWSGPRSVSTALMRAWGNRADTAVIDEPFYGYYLSVTGVNHPGREEALASQPRDWQTVVRHLIGPIPENKKIWYQKHHAHHLLPSIPLDWINELTNCFLIRHPRLILSSYRRIRPSFSAADIGLANQVAIFQHVRSRKKEVPPVLDASDLLRDPESHLRALCAAVGVEFDTAMLSWPAGPRATDQVVAPYWYTKVEKSTGFFPYVEQEASVPQRLRSVLEECMECYMELFRYRLQVN